MDIWGRFWGWLSGRPATETEAAPRPAPSFSHEVAKLILSSSGSFSLAEAQTVTDVAEHLHREGNLSNFQVQHLAESLRLRVDLTGANADALAGLLGRLKALAVPAAASAVPASAPGCFLGYEAHQERDED